MGLNIAGRRQNINNVFERFYRILYTDKVERFALNYIILII